MSKSDTAAQESAATTHGIDHDRYVRALVEDMDVLSLGPGTYEVRHDGGTYGVDLRNVHCTCPDHEYRDARCKHLIRAALHAAFTEGVRTEFTAAVVRASDHYGCADGYEGCEGPTGDTLPCQTCIHGTSTGEWTVWAVLVDGRPAREVTPDVGEGVDRGVGVATDGGEVSAANRSSSVERSESDGSTQVTLADATDETEEDSAVEPIAEKRECGHLFHPEQDRNGCLLCELGEKYDVGGDDDDDDDPDTIIDDHGIERPARTEAPDMGGGEASGVDEL
ncbi:SWIM zinc finger family protein [Halococcus sp. PRR34]|uniref:SWIM zinc finger family protein n=1 Tax=Halococcus sp. PRR34 TaxID=3020830 RepID=UPI002362C651|nr:SWIM zinc finger family protein [Halococcus sp. PRR34]